MEAGVSILQEGGHFSGINRKAQLKPLSWDPIPEGKRREPKDRKDPPRNASPRHSDPQIRRRSHTSGRTRRSFSAEISACACTPVGITTIPPPLMVCSACTAPIVTILRSTSDEGRVQITAGVAKGLLDLETDNNQLTPVSRPL